MPKPTGLRGRITAEFLGAFGLLLSVVGSGIWATRWSHDVGVQVVINATSIGLALGVLIWLVAPISGAHFNPLVTATAVVRRELSLGTGIGYALAQFAGAIAGVFFANLMFDLPAAQLATAARASLGSFLGEVLATAALITLVIVLGSRGQGRLAPIVIGGWIVSAIFFTSSTSFANPAVTIARIFSDTLTGINPTSAVVFIAGQIIGLPLGWLAGRFFSKG